jgi:hypothetical protein
MLYSSFNHPADSALIWKYGPDAQIITVGSTSGDATAPSKFAPLSWNEFSRDLIVAAHFSPVVGIYSLPGCVQRGYLPRLRIIDWAQPVTIQSSAIRIVALLRARIQAVLWTLSHLAHLAAAILLLDAACFTGTDDSRLPTQANTSPETETLYSLLRLLSLVF